MIRSWVLAILVISISLRKKNGLKKVITTKQPYIQFIRGILLILAILIGVYSFTKLGLVQTHSILSSFPLIVVAFSGPILKEKIGIQRWMAVLFGFIGVLIILNPADFIIGMYCSHSEIMDLPHDVALPPIHHILRGRESKHFISFWYF